MENNHINTWAQLKDLIGPEHGRDIEKQGKDGDPDWLWDILMEAKEGIKPDNNFYITWFHGPLQGKTFNASLIYDDYLTHIK